jgi:hypothetical protein
MFVIASIIGISIVLSGMLCVLARGRRPFAVSIATSIVVAVSFQGVTALKLGYFDPFALIAMTVSFVLSFASSLPTALIARKYRDRASQDQIDQMNQSH